MDMSKLTLPPVMVVTNESQAKLIIDPMRTKILRLLTSRPCTAKELSDTIHLTPPSIGHHLKALVHGELVSIVKQEAESHGIMQKWYRAKAQTFIVDEERLPIDVRRYFMPIDIERARGVLACASLLRDNVTPSTGHMEKLTYQICRSICKTARRLDDRQESDPERVVHRLYVEALRPIIS